MSFSFVRTLTHCFAVDSTSDLARLLVVENRAELPLVVRATRQTRGRGRGTHAWWSDEGSLTFTIALDPAAHGLRVEHEPRLALASAVAVVDALEPVLPGVGLGIRWPNDIEAAGRKLAGILPERIETDRGTRLLIGIGLNVATRLDDAPPEVRRMATTVAALRPQAAPLVPDEASGIFGAILDRFEKRLACLARDDPALADRWAQLDTLRKRPVRVDLGSRVVIGLGQGIDARGGLRLADDDGWRFTIFGGQVLRDP